MSDPGESERRWRQDLRAGVARPADLEQLPLDAADRSVATLYKVRVPASQLERIDWSDPDDPIRRQLLPSAEELTVLPGELEDPIGDEAHSPVPRVTHRYPDRALLYPTYVCSAYCRHCFRKQTLNDQGTGFSMAALEPALDYFARTPALREVILTGGDPLTLSDDQLRSLRERLEAIPHLRMIRVHSRIPVTLPTRVTPGLVAALSGRLMTAVVTHFNHPREIGPEAIEACRLLRTAGFMLLNQTVLLAGVNDEVETMKTLCQELVYALGAKPYYLHHCDLTRGVSHFRTSIDAGLELVRALRGHVSGLCQPTYVLDLPGGAGKVPLGPGFVRGREGHDWQFSTYDGETVDYREVLRPDPDES
ncbi:MAG: KamA family radical SAM protein [Myxococcales bacterium]|nr:KamA family radical SAM protein [Myxococcales bacterium]